MAKLKTRTNDEVESENIEATNISASTIGVYGLNVISNLQLPNFDIYSPDVSIEISDYPIQPLDLRMYENKHIHLVIGHGDWEYWDDEISLYLPFNCVITVEMINGTVNDGGWFTSSNGCIGLYVNETTLPSTVSLDTFSIDGSKDNNLIIVSGMLVIARSYT